MFSAKLKPFYGRTFCYRKIFTGLNLFDICEAHTTLQSLHLPVSYFIYPNIQYPTILYPTLPYPTILYPTIPYPTILYPTILYPTILYPTIIYPTIYPTLAPYY